ncbi:glycosyltransferase family 4 protein [Botrimarina sp.]|uniref:glycosyltransferase family 4 protein n=1 Tax=Botrimarina sp. TaxID=2795802 RepID=UPI0032EBCB07
MPDDPTPTPDPRPVLSIYGTAVAPYELHLYRRIADELPLRVQTFAASEDSTRQWRLDEVESIGLVDLSEGRKVPRMASLADQRHAWRVGGRVIEHMKRAGSRAIIVNGYYDLGRLRTIFWCWRTGRVCLLRGDSNIADDLQNGPAKRAVKRLLVGAVGKLTDGALVVGPLGFDYWRQYGFSDERMHCVSYEPDYALIESITDAEVADAARRFGLDPARRRLVFSGRLIPVKRVDLLIDAFARLAPDRPEWDLLVLGDGELRDELQARVPEGLRDRVIWTGFLADQRDVSRLYRAGDLLVLPSDREPWALVVNEAAAAGLAIVATDVVGAAAALVRPGKNGDTFPRGDLDALTAALQKTTAPDAIDRLKAGSAEVLAAWRRDFDPVRVLRNALVQNGVLAG